MSDNAIDDKIDEWHTGSSTEPLYIHLGMSWEEYCAWVKAKDKMKFNPLEDRILLRRDEAEKEKKVGSILLPTTAIEQPLTGTVLAVGTGRFVGEKFIENRLKVGDRVVFGKYAATEITVDGEDLWVSRESDIFGTLSD